MPAACHAGVRSAGLRVARRCDEGGHKKRDGCICQPPRLGEEF
jgi:hypothetical protein